ncbi:MAG: hypothetical protein ACQETE_03965 [Bacteroidota bacterium]
MQAIDDNIHGSRQLLTKALKIVDNGWRNVRPLKSYGTIRGQDNSTPTLHYIKDRSSGLRAPFFEFEEDIIIGLFVFSKQSTQQESVAFERAQELQYEILEWLEDNEENYKAAIQKDE